MVRLWLRAVRADREIWVGLVGCGLAAVGWWWLRSFPLSLIGALVALSSGVLYGWQRQCLTGVSYRRTLARTRVNFGEAVTLNIEIVNDKLIPVTWLQIEDDVPAALELRGGTVTGNSVMRLVTVLPVLPYQRVRRHVTVLCRERGRHRFGPAVLRSGDPVGLRTRSIRVEDHQHLLVFPKQFVLDLRGVAAQVLIGDTGARHQFLHDPSRVAGVRPYRPGDALRSVDWRATARSTEVLVRQFEATVSPRVALFVDFRVPQTYDWAPDPSRLEFVIALSASLLAELAGRQVSVGLFASGSVDQEPLAFPPTSAPGQLPLVLEALARCTAIADAHFPAVLTAQSGHLRTGTSAVVVASHYPDETLVALAELRRRHAVTAIWIRSERGEPPPREQVDALMQVEYTDDWRDREIVELAS